MRERTKGLGGILTIDTAPDEGTEIDIVLSM
jgi:signal transduction histidine kinase